MKMLLLGATGRTGSNICQQALAAGHQVHVLVRDAQKLTEKNHRGLRIWEGDVRQPHSLLKAGEGTDVVISALNVSRVNDFPWSPLRTPPDFLSTTMQNLLQVWPLLGAKGLVLCSAIGVGNSAPLIPGWFRWLIRNSNLQVPYADHHLQEQLLRASAIPHIIVRPVGLTNGALRHDYYLSEALTPCPSALVSRKTLAHAMLQLAYEPIKRSQTLHLSNL